MDFNNCVWVKTPTAGLKAYYAHCDLVSNWVDENKILADVKYGMWGDMCGVALWHIPNDNDRMLFALRWS